MVYLHEQSLSPDPTYGRTMLALGDNQQTALVYPHRLLHAWPESAETARWGGNLNIFRAPPPLVLSPGPDGRVGFFVDFATELDAEVVLEVATSSLANVLFWRGESILEAEGCIHDGRPQVLFSVHIPDPGTHTARSNAHGFRFVRIEFHDLTGPVTVKSVAAAATWTFQRRDGDFHCSDTRFQRVWQSSIYTARLCTRLDAIWDGIKRDRIGWYGDARIIKEATDQVFFDPRPAEAMLMKLPTTEWVNGIPNFSFDAIAILKSHILRYGLGRECVLPTFHQIADLLDWARKSQVNEDGFIIRVEGQNYSFDMGFLDWSEYPQGGRHEELGWLQATYLGGLRNAADIANVITPYFAYYEQSARALCGDPTSALRVFRDYIGGMLETEDAATIWEYYIPTLRDLRRYSSHLDLNWNWPTSLCHGWGAGAVPLTTEFLLGIIPLKPGFSEIKLSPAAGLTWDYEARVPTPFGPITVEKNGSSGKPHFIVPKDISIRETTATKSELTVDFSN